MHQKFVLLQNIEKRYKLTMPRRNLGLLIVRGILLVRARVAVLVIGVLQFGQSFQLQVKFTNMLHPRIGPVEHAADEDVLWSPDEEGHFVIQRRSGELPEGFAGKT